MLCLSLAKRGSELFEMVLEMVQTSPNHQLASTGSLKKKAISELSLCRVPLLRECSEAVVARKMGVGEGHGACCLGSSHAPSLLLKNNSTILD